MAKNKHNSPTSNKYAYMAPSKIHQKGLFARCGIDVGTDIVEYDGPRISKQEGEKLAKEDNSYIFVLDRKTCIDGSVKWNLARYANHSCTPNCKTTKISGRIWLRSIRKIVKGEEITYNYGYEFKNYKDNPCNCGSSECRGYIVSETHRDRV